MNGYIVSGVDRAYADGTNVAGERRDRSLNRVYNITLQDYIYHEISAIFTIDTSLLPDRQSNPFVFDSYNTNVRLDAMQWQWFINGDAVNPLASTLAHRMSNDTTRERALLRDNNDHAYFFHVNREYGYDQSNRQVSFDFEESYIHLYNQRLRDLLTSDDIEQTIDFKTDVPVRTPNHGMQSQGDWGYGYLRAIGFENPDQTNDLRGRAGYDVLARFNIETLSLNVQEVSAPGTLGLMTLSILLLSLNRRLKKQKSI